MSAYRDQRGFAILTAIFVMVILAMLGAASIALISGAAEQAMDEMRTEEALHVALAGRAYIAGQLKNDSDWSDNAGVMKSFAGGSFTAAYLAQTVDAVRVQIDGTVGGITRQIQQDFARGTIDAWTKAIYTTEDIVSGGAASGDINGPVSAGQTVSTGGGVDFNGDVERNNTRAAIPMPDWNYWQSHADHVISGNYNFTSGTFSGIYYVTGDVTLHANMTLTGTIVSRGRVLSNAQSNIVITAALGNPAIIAEQEVRINGGADISITGWVISTGTLTLTGTSGVTATGGFVAQGDVTFSGNNDIQLTYNRGLAPGFGFYGGAMGGGGEGNYIVFALWKETF
jgi:type II secretory pathway pseudopilin PulG